MSWGPAKGAAWPGGCLQGLALQLRPEPEAVGGEAGRMPGWDVKRQLGMAGGLGGWSGWRLWAVGADPREP